MNSNFAMVVRPSFSSPLPPMYEISSPGSDHSPSAEALYGFATRLHPINQSGAHPHQFAMPQSNQQYRSNSYIVGSGVARPTSAASKRGGRRPKEYEEFGESALSEEERDKRDKRRLRNKEAAARCRQRRLDLMGTLQSQVDQLKEANKNKDLKIAQLNQLKNELLAVIHEHNCVLPDELRRSLGADMSLNTQYLPRPPVPTTMANLQHFAPTQQAAPQSMVSRKRPASEMVSDLTQPPQPQPQPQPNVSLQNHPTASMPLPSNSQTTMPLQIKQEPTLYDVNGRDLPEEKIDRPTSLPFSEAMNTTVASYSSISSSGVPITTPSNLLSSGQSEYGTNLLDGPTGLTPCHPPQATAFQITSLSTPLSDGRSFENL